MEERPDDQDWGSLPENCPIREQGREAFDELWGGIETWALAVVDPYPDSSNRIEYAWMFVWLISDLDSEDWTSVTGLGEKARKVRQVEEFQNHLYWLLIKGSAEELELLLKNLKKCQTNLQKEGMQALRLFLTAADRIEAGYFSDDPEQGTTPSLAAVKQLCRREDPDLFPAVDDAESWRTLERRALRVRSFHRPGKGGRPPKSQGRK